jgi:MOSC domain-containing protein YiiM
MAKSSSGPQSGKVVALAIRPARKAPMLSVTSVEAINGTGLVGDVHADDLSPRQILLASFQAYEDLGLPSHSLRENLLVDFDTSLLTSGTVLQIGAQVRLWLTFQCEACGHLNVHRAALSRDIGSRRGVLARVLEGGAIRTGDQVRVLGALLPEWSDDWRHRVARVLNEVPSGEVIEYKQLARLAGVPTSYCRVFPRFAKTLGPAIARKAIPMTAKSTKPRWRGDSFFNLLSVVGHPTKNATLPNQTIIG